MPRNIIQVSEQRRLRRQHTLRICYLIGIFHRNAGEVERISAIEWSSHEIYCSRDITFVRNERAEITHTDGCTAQCPLRMSQHDIGQDSVEGFCANVVCRFSKWSNVILLNNMRKHVRKMLSERNARFLLLRSRLRLSCACISCVRLRLSCTTIISVYHCESLHKPYIIYSQT